MGVVTDRPGVVGTAHCLCGAAVAWVRDFVAADTYGVGFYGQPYTDESWMVHTEPPVGGAHVPIRVGEWVP